MSEKRSDWPVQRSSLTEQGRSPRELSSEECIAMMWELARQAWLVAGRRIPDYTREQTPVRLVRRAP